MMVVVTYSADFVFMSLEVLAVLTIVKAGFD
jgi:hypothetical protein